MSNRAFDTCKQLLPRYRLRQEILGAGLDGLHAHRDVSVTGQKNNRQRGSLFDQLVLQFGPAQIRYLHIE